MATLAIAASLLPLDESFLRKDHLLSIYNAIKNWSPNEQRKFLEDNITNVTPLLPFIDYLFSSETVQTELLYHCFKLAFISINQNAVLENQPKKVKAKASSSDFNNKRKSQRLLKNLISSSKSSMPEPVLVQPEQLKQKSPIPIKRKASDLLERNCPNPLGCTSPEMQRKVRKPCPARKFASVVYKGWNKPEI